MDVWNVFWTRSNELDTTSTETPNFDKVWSFGRRISSLKKTRVTNVGLQLAIWQTGEPHLEIIQDLNSTQRSILERKSQQEQPPHRHRVKQKPPTSVSSLIFSSSASKVNRANFVSYHQNSKDEIAKNRVLSMISYGNQVGVQSLHKGYRKPPTNCVVQKLEAAVTPYIWESHLVFLWWNIPSGPSVQNLVEQCQQVKTKQPSKSAIYSLP